MGYFLAFLNVAPFILEWTLIINVLIYKLTYDPGFL